MKRKIVENLVTKFILEINHAAASKDSLACSKIRDKFNTDSKKLENCTEEIAENLRALVVENQSKRPPGLSLWLTTAYDHPSQEYVEPLCALLTTEGDPSIPYERIADLLYELASPKSIPYLEKACSISYSDNEEDGVGWRCLDALYAINTPEAWNAIQRLTTSSFPGIRSGAQKIINSRQ